MQGFDQLSLGLRRRLPVILQTEAAECGLACLAMVASYHGYRIDLASLRRRHPVSLRGTTLATLIDIAHRLDLASRAVRLDLKDIRRLGCPCILHWNFSHFVVLRRASRRAISIHDPASGGRTLSLDEASDSFTGVALELWPNSSFKPRNEKQHVRLRDLMGHTRGLYRSLGQILVLAVVLEVFAAVSPLFLQWVIDHSLLSASTDLLTLLALGFGLLVVLQQAVTALRAWVIMHISTTLNIQWQANVFTHLLRLPMPYFEKRHLGDIVSRFRSVDVIQRTLTTAFVEAIVDGLTTVVILTVVFLYSPLLSWICIGSLSFYASMRWLWYRPLRIATEEQIVQAAKQEGHFLETVRGVRSIKLFQRHDERRSSWLTLLVDQVNSGLRAQKLQIFYKLINGLSSGIENVLVIWLGAGLVLAGQFSVGMLIAFASYKGQLSARVTALIDKVFEFKMLRLQGERLADIVLARPEPHDCGGRLVVSNASSLEPTVAIRNLRFKYAEHEAYVLDGVDLTIAAGESVAIVGSSGCGKTTLLHVMLGVLPATAGEVLIGGKSVARIGTEALRRTIGCVTQNDTLFAGSIADNISFFDSRIDQRRVEECARLASIHAEVVAMPMGYNTFVGYMGSVLSGGQQQRILLARALYKRPAILLLDEATSHLDVQREIVVSSAIRALNLTRIIVAHRPHTVATADRVVTLRAGRIVKQARITSAAAASVRRRFAAATQKSLESVGTT
jgi:ATP-binding cassette subfamily B protein RaxB